MSPGSSSTSSTSTAWPWRRSVMRVLILGQRGQGETEPGTGGDRRVQPDAATVIFNDLPAHGQPNTRSRVCGLVMQALEDHEDPLGVLGGDPDAVVGEREQPVLAVPVGRHRDAWRLVGGELQRVA